MYKRMYLFHEPEDCCQFWFGHDSVTDCASSVIQSVYIDANTTITATVDPLEELKTMWYPQLELQVCLNDGNMPQFMLEDGYTEWYLFNTKEACCGTFGCSGERRD